MDASRLETGKTTNGWQLGLVPAGRMCIDAGRELQRRDCLPVDTAVDPRGTGTVGDAK